jgi:trk system potassium uptake protein TrkA
MRANREVINMRLIIIGCGKLGSELALAMQTKGHEVIVVDTDPEAFDQFGGNFRGKTIVGIGFDKDVLDEAGIDRADAVVACSKSDETNALIGKLARDVYHVPKVISRLYDPRRAKIYRSLGIQTLSTTHWGVQRAIDLLSYDQLDSVLSLGDGQMEIIRVEVPALLVERSVKELTVYGEIQVVSILRNNKIILPSLTTILKEHDHVFIAMLSSSAERLKALLGLM